jgi:heparin binding hemagglutinin HbhA
MATRTETRKMPAPLYAAAGAGDLAYQELRKLPERMEMLRVRVEKLRPAVTDVVSERSLRLDVEKLRSTARSTAAAFVTGAQAAQERAVAAYEELVARGERVVASARATEARAQLATARAESKDADLTEGKVASPQADLPTVADKAVKRTRPAAARK